MDPHLINQHRRTSIYNESDFYRLAEVIGSLESLVIIPNVWTEADNLLNGFRGAQKDRYLFMLKKMTEETTEQFLATSEAMTDFNVLYDLGITDSLLLKHSLQCELLITSDSRLADYAVANGVSVYDVVKNRNQRL